MTDKVQKIREEVVKMHNLLPVMDGDNISVNYADRICTTLEMYIDSLQEEPVSDTQSPVIFYGLTGSVGSPKEEPVSEVLEQAAVKAFKEIVDGGRNSFLEIFKAGAEWQKEKDFQYVKKECERTGSCCDNDIAIEATKRHPYYYVSEMEAYANIGFKEGAMWQKEQDQETIELAEDHAMLAGRMQMKEEMMAEAIETTFNVSLPSGLYDKLWIKGCKEGDKLLVIKK